MSIFTKDFSDEEMARDWTLSESDLKQISTVISSYRLYFAIQLCAIRLQGGFLAATSDLSPRIINYLGSQLDLPLTFVCNEPTRRATRSKQHGQNLTYLGFKKYDRETNIILKNWIIEKAEQGLLPKDILCLAGEFLVGRKVVLPSRKTLERKINSLCSKVHSRIFETIYEQMPSSLKRNLNEILVSEDNQVSFFSLLKESPPAAKISSLKTYLERYKKLEEITLEQFDLSSFNSSFIDYLFGLAKYYNAADLKRFNKQKRLSLLICFLLEARKQLLDNIIKMHDQFMIDLSRRTRNRYEKKHKQLRRKNKRAVDILLKTSDILLNWQADSPLHREDVFEIVDEEKLRESVADLYEFKYLG